MIQGKFNLASFRKSFGERSETALGDSINLILQEVQLMSLSVGNGETNVCPVYFSLYDDATLCFVLNLNSRHASLLGKTDAASVAIYNSNQPRTKPKAGIQMAGSCKQASIAESLKARERFAERFPENIDSKNVTEAVARAMAGLRFYLFVPNEIKILDESRFGEETYIDLVKGQ